MNHSPLNRVNIAMIPNPSALNYLHESKRIYNVDSTELSIEPTTGLFYDSNDCSTSVYLTVGPDSNHLQSRYSNVIIITNYNWCDWPVNDHHSNRKENLITRFDYLPPVRFILRFLSSSLKSLQSRKIVSSISDEHI